MVENYENLVSNANLAFSNGEYQMAWDLADQAIRVNPKKVDGYLSAGKSAMSVDDTKSAIEYFKKAANLEDSSGNVYFLLGYAQAMSGGEASALRSLTRAIEKNCDEELKGQIYMIMAMINSDKEDYKDALINIEQAEQYLGISYDLLRQRAACYANMKDYKKTLFTLNQMKLFQPKEYVAYSLAFHIFMDLGIYDEAKKELERARDYADLTMTYYSDRVAYAFMHDIKESSDEKVNRRWRRTLQEIDYALRKGKPNAEEAYEMYLRAAQLYLSLEQSEKALKCLEFSEDPVASFNQGVSVLIDDSFVETGAAEPTELSLEEEEERMQERWDNGEFDDITEQIREALDYVDDDDPEQATETVQKYLSPTDVVPIKEEKEEEYHIDGEFLPEQAQKDMKDILYISAYELKHDYDNMFEKTRDLQMSDIVANQYTGMYFELRVSKYRNEDNWQKKYRDRINFWKKKMIEDPTDVMSASYRIRCHVDIGEYDEAEQLCGCLSAEARDSLMEEIQKARAEGGSADGGISE